MRNKDEVWEGKGEEGRKEEEKEEKDREGGEKEREKNPEIPTGTIFPRVAFCHHPHLFLNP